MDGNGERPGPTGVGGGAAGVVMRRGDAEAPAIVRRRATLDERAVYEAIVLHGFQCGLAWDLVEARRAAFRAAFAGFDPDAVAAFGERDVERLLADASIVRNARKIRAAVDNARAVLRLRASGGVVELVRGALPASTRATPVASGGPTRSVESVALADALRAAGFRFVGAVSMHALLESTGLVEAVVRGPGRI